MSDDTPDLEPTAMQRITESAAELVGALRSIQDPGREVLSGLLADARGSPWGANPPMAKRATGQVVRRRPACRTGPLHRGGGI